MTTSDNVLDNIDHALHDWDTSPDAMRWTPEAPPGPVPRFDPVVFAAAANRFADAYRAAMRGLVQKLNEMSPVILRAFRLMQSFDADAQVRRSAMHSEYHRRQKRRKR
jgi:hypothetical protein